MSTILLLYSRYCSCAAISLRKCTRRPAPTDVAEAVDQAIADELCSTTQTELAPRTDDATFARRVWLDIVGDIPTPEELTAFLLDPARRQTQHSSSRSCWPIRTTA